MQSVQEFMQEFFRARIAEEQRHQASRAPFRQKYYADECQTDSRSRTLEIMESEEIVNIAEGDSGPAVITIHKNPFYKPGAQTHRKRYHLKAAGSSWLIRLVETECPFCHGTGDETCIYCKGKHWRGGGQMTKEKDEE